MTAHPLAEPRLPAKRKAMDQASVTAPLTPLMKQYYDLKAQAQDALMFFRMGDFYELFGPDAVEASRILEITLTSRDKGKANPTPMAGVPHHSAQGYIQRLLKAGKKVAICEQMEEASHNNSQAPGKTIVRREIVRTFTPAVHFDLEMGGETSYLVVALRAQNTTYSIACVDSSTGEVLAADEIPESSLSNELAQLPIKHFLRIGHALPEDALTHLRAQAQGNGLLLEDLPSNYLSLEQAQAYLKKIYKLESLEQMVGTTPVQLAVAILVTYIAKSQGLEQLSHLRLPKPLHRTHTLALGTKTALHLDLLPTPDGTPNLFNLINHTQTAMGARRLKRWITEPLSDTAQILARQETVTELFSNQSTQARIKSCLTNIYDLERITGRIASKLANPRDTLALGKSLTQVPFLVAQLESMRSPLLTDTVKKLTELNVTLESLAKHIVTAQREDAPLVSRDGGIFNLGMQPDLDRLILLNQDGQKWLVDLETREREATGINTLKVRYNRVFGYYIEVTASHIDKVPAHYQRKQTTVGAERFFTEELKKFEEDIVTAGVKQKSLEQTLFSALLDQIHGQTQPIMDLAVIIAEIDALNSISNLLGFNGWTMPTIDDGLEVEIRSGRHPMVDQVSGGSFVPNDLLLSPQTHSTLLITGPNMGGKSTIMRQIALIVILGQMGAPVPALLAKWGVFTQVFTRIGAQDAISKGQSTFMVEMAELAQILHHATPRALIILDEIGRGTSTFDGMSVAWATLEHLCLQTHARTLFATHYHELTHLSRTLPGLANAHMAVEATRETEGKSAQLRFLYKLEAGPANESFGIHVASLAGIPVSVTDRAWKVLKQLEEQQSHTPTPFETESGPVSRLVAKPEPELFGQMTFFAPPQETKIEFKNHPVIEEIQTLKIEEMTPIQALNFLVHARDATTTSQSRAPKQA